MSFELGEADESGVGPKVIGSKALGVTLTYIVCTEVLLLLPSQCILRGWVLLLERSHACVEGCWCGRRQSGTKT